MQGRNDIMLMRTTRTMKLQYGCNKAKINRELTFPYNLQKISKLDLSSLIIVVVLLLASHLSLCLFDWL